MVSEYCQTTTSMGVRRDLDFLRTYIHELKVYVNFTSYIYIYIYTYFFLLSCPSLEKFMQTLLTTSTSDVGLSNNTAQPTK